MRPFAVISAITLALAGAAGAAQSSQPCNGICMPSKADMEAVKFGYSVQNLLYQYYKSVPPPRREYQLPGNAMGLQRQAWLGIEALQQFGHNKSMSWPNCTYKLPTPPSSAKDHLKTAYMIEATLCGTFIGLGDYVQSPEAAFLMARLAAEHGIHASYIGSHMKPQIFMKNSSALTPAFTPQHVLKPGMSVGHLGQWMDKCVAAPEPPCGDKVKIGDLGSNVTGSNNMTRSPSSSGGMGGGSKSSPTTPVQTNAGSVMNAWFTPLLGLLIGAALV
ncbi:hypothetical protein PHISP_04926 [Aspergillus sp. HF37]|nr:hypothetical protein PHISP_04926 [Aspergillus sp. HF37]